MKKIIVGLIIVGTIGYARNYSNAAMDFLKLGQGARVNGIGEAFVGLADDINTLYWNPAGLGQLKDREVTIMYLKPFNEINGLSYSYLASVFPMKEPGCFGTSISYYGYGEEERYDASGSDDGTWEAFDMGFCFGLGGMIQDNLSLGGSLKAIYGEIDKSNAWGLCSDIGVLYMLPSIPDMKIGAVIKNIGTRIKFEEESDPLPLTLKTGFSYHLPETLPPITVVLDATFPDDNDLYVGMGGEYVYQNVLGIMLALRMGFKSGPQEEGSGLTAGVGIKGSRFGFDFAYQPGDDELGDSYFISFQAKY